MQQDRRRDKRKRASGKMRNGGTVKGKSWGTKCKGEKVSVREESSVAWGSVPVLNISITDWAAMKMLLIHTPKDFYKTSISLSWLQHSGIHRGRKSKKCSEGEKYKKKKKLFLLSGFSPSKLSSLCCRKLCFLLFFFVFFLCQLCCHAKRKYACGCACTVHSVTKHGHFEDMDLKDSCMDSPRAVNPRKLENSLTSKSFSKTKDSACGCGPFQVI